MIFWSFILEIIVLRIKKNFIKSKNYFLIYLNFFYKLFSKNLIAKIAKIVIFAVFNFFYLNMHFLPFKYKDFNIGINYKNKIE